MNQTAPTGCNSTFRCRTGGHPKPAITWIRNGSDSNIVNETNPRINITTDHDEGQSRLVIAGVTNTIIAFIFVPQKNRFGKKVSNPAFLSYPKGWSWYTRSGASLSNHASPGNLTRSEVTSSTPWQEHSVIFRVSRSYHLWQLQKYLFRKR